jgi:hypothetical protein
MKVTRGVFLAACGAGLLGTVMDAGALEGATADTAGVVPHARPDDLRSQVGTTFQLEATDGSQPVILAEVRDRSVEWRIEQCSALFRGDAAAALSDGTYAFHHPALGRFQLFVVALGPGGMHAPHVYYEACISRFRSFEERHGD